MTVGLVSTRPGVRVEQFSPAPALDFRTGVAGFVGPAVAAGSPQSGIPGPALFTSWYDFTIAARGDDPSWRVNSWHPDEWTWNAVQGFFKNGGARCWLSMYDARASDPRAALDGAVTALAGIDDVDLVCAPSLLGATDPLAMQQQLIRSFEQRDDWFLILDPPDVGVDLATRLRDLRAAPCARPQDVALYYPWVRVGSDFDLAPEASTDRTPPSGHVAGVFARTDRDVGVHKAPANEPIDGIVDIDDVGDIDGANPLRAFPGRGIRVWGARTLALVDTSDPGAFINVRRLILTLERWLVRALDWTVFEANDFRLWVRVHRELNAVLGDLFLRGAFAGKTPDEAFAIKCDAENNDDQTRSQGQLHVDVQIAPTTPKQFITVRVVRDATGLTAT